MNEGKFEELMKKQEESVKILTPFYEFSNAIDRTNRQLDENMKLTDRQIAKTLNFLAEKVYNR